MATPVAAYDIAGIDQLVKHEHTGLLATLGDKATLSDHWERLLDDQDFADKIGQNARIYVNEHYSAKRMADEYMTLFNKMLQAD